ncbi:MAG: sulfotransferase domain-containing protein [Cyanobacteria bacterium J06635_10]
MSPINNNDSTNMFPENKKLVVKDYLRDSTIWDEFTHRKNDIVIVSCYKSGTTLTQQILNLLLRDRNESEYLYAVSPWVEFRLEPRKHKLELIDKLAEPRFFKSHLPFESLPYYPEWKYICLFRDGRDVAASLFNHAHAYIPEAYAESASNVYQTSSNFSEFWEEWLVTGKPLWDFWEFINSWWKVRHLPNIILVHFADLVNNKFLYSVIGMS